MGLESCVSVVVLEMWGVEAAFIGVFFFSFSFSLFFLGGSGAWVA